MNSQTFGALAIRPTGNVQGLLHLMLHHTMTKYHVNHVLKVFGEQGEAIVLAELKQLHVRDVIKPMCAHELIKEEHADALP